jgi:hypothetical protein
MKSKLGVNVSDEEMLQADREKQEEEEKQKSKESAEGEASENFDSQQM